MVENNKNESREAPHLSNEERRELLENIGWSPERATKMLEDLGYEEKQTWESLEKKGMGSHEWRAYVRIARGTEVQLLGEVVMQIREEDGLPPQGKI